MVERALTPERLRGGARASGAPDERYLVRRGDGLSPRVERSALFRGRSATRGSEVVVSLLPPRGRGVDTARGRSVEHVLLFELHAVSAEEPQEF